MTGPGDDMSGGISAALTRTLRHHAEEAPSAEGLPEKAMAVASRRRRHRINASIAAIVLLVVGIPVAVVATINGRTPVAQEAHPTWRWETYRGVQVQVPPDWVYGYGVSRRCAESAPDATRPVRPGVVGRPMATALPGCTVEDVPVKQRENWLAFGRTDKVGERRLDHGWVEETRRVHGVLITVFSNDATLRSAIFGSAEPVIGADRYGCPTDPPVLRDPKGYRPVATEGGLPAGSTVRSISVCRYELGSNPAPPLLSSGRISGRDAQEAVDAIRSAPEGEGPDVENGNPGNNGGEVVVLRVDTVSGVREVVVRYAGESGNGFDDGTTKRKLTADAVRPLLSGANAPGQFSLAVVDLIPKQQ